MATWDEVHYRGGFYGYCKACGEPMSLKHAHNYDMAICWDCADGIDMVYYDVMEDDDDEEAFTDCRNGREPVSRRLY